MNPQLEPDPEWIREQRWYPRHTVSEIKTEAVIYTVILVFGLAVIAFWSDPPDGNCVRLSGWILVYGPIIAAMCSGCSYILRHDRVDFEEFTPQGLRRRVYDWHRFRRQKVLDVIIPYGAIEDAVLEGERGRDSEGMDRGRMYLKIRGLGLWRHPGYSAGFDHMIEEIERFRAAADPTILAPITLDEAPPGPPALPPSNAVAWRVAAITCLVVALFGALLHTGVPSDRDGMCHRLDFVNDPLVAPEIEMRPVFTLKDRNMTAWRMTIPADQVGCNEQCLELLRKDLVEAGALKEPAGWVRDVHAVERWRRDEPPRMMEYLEEPRFSSSKAFPTEERKRRVVEVLRGHRPRLQDRGEEQPAQLAADPDFARLPPPPPGTARVLFLCSGNGRVYVSVPFQDVRCAVGCVERLLQDLQQHTNDEGPARWEVRDFGITPTRVPREARGPQFHPDLLLDTDVRRRAVDVLHGLRPRLN